MKDLRTFTAGKLTENKSFTTNESKLITINSMLRGKKAQS
jgi:hypothetical protein